ncbi:MAG TPA: hypothetical protein VL981_11330 [Candidatus Methylacidiphilales bacterium]|nr:hypothetical protein [Candidatus Methylacidiphilales bacterium]
MKFLAGCIGLILFFGAAGQGTLLAARTATITARDPVTFIKGDSCITRPVRPDEVFSVVTVASDQVTIADEDGYEATLNRGMLRITDSTPSPPSVPATNAVPADQTRGMITKAAPTATLSSPVTNNPGGTSDQAPAVPALNPEDADKIKQLNKAFQMPLFTTTNLWDEDADTVAQRLQWPQESNTSFDASYRRYALGDETVTVLGARAYSLALYARNGHPTYLSIVFANKGDFGEIGDVTRKKLLHLDVAPGEMEKAVQDLNAAVKTDAGTINAQLTSVLGDPESHVFGPTADSREFVHRWDWNGHAILFTSPRDEYAAIKMVPSEVADHFGDVANLDRDAIKEALAKRVLRRDNGDVVLQDIPMVDQGPKGYCVPATWERYLRYVDVPADMYVLALIGDTNFWGGTNFDIMREAVNSYVESYHRRVEMANVPLDVDHLTKFIDQGLPLMWSCFYVKSVEKEINEHTFLERKTVTDWNVYKTRIEADDQSLTPVNFADPNLSRHMRMIIGYNAGTNELAISDSWGLRYTERWITVKEAQTISTNDLTYIQW